MEIETAFFLSFIFLSFTAGVVMIRLYEHYQKKNPLLAKSFVGFVFIMWAYGLTSLETSHLGPTTNPEVVVSSMLLFSAIFLGGVKTAMTRKWKKRKMFFS